MLQAMARWQKNTRKAVSHVPLIQAVGFERVGQEICVERGGLALADGEGMSMARNCRGVCFPCRMRHQQWIPPTELGHPWGDLSTLHLLRKILHESGIPVLSTLLSSGQSCQGIRAVPWLLSPGSARALLHLAPAAQCREGSPLPASFPLEEQKTTSSSQQERKL